MSIRINCGGPAFPLPSDNINFPASHGLSLRDYLAARASEEDVNNHTWKGFKEDFVQQNLDGTKSVVKRQAHRTREEAKYCYADAMIKAGLA